MLQDLTFPASRTATFEFIQMTGKVASVPHTSRTAQWDGKMLKVLVGQGQLYVRLLRDYKVVRATTSSSDDDFDDAP